jgi:hypothetical protein
MNISPKSVSIDQDRPWVELSDGRTLGALLAWFPRLLNASPEQLKDFELTPKGIHWDSLDEDISINGLLLGQGDLTHRRSEVA